MRIEFIRNSYRRFYAKHKKELDAAIQNCLSKGELTLRKEVWDFEKRLARYIETKYAIGVNSGTDALFLSLKALGIGPGDEVITVSHTFIASLQAIVHCGATPVLVDVDLDELIDIEKIEQVITKRTKVILPVHYTGKVCEMDSIMELAKKHRLYVIEDACQSLGASYNGIMAGAFGDTGCFSFNTAKMMGAYGDAGAITTNNKNLYVRLNLLRNHWNMAQLSVNKKDFPQPKTLGWGWKSRLDNIQAAVLNVKLKYLDWMIRRRQEIANQYISRVKETDNFCLPWNYNGQVWQEFHVRAKNQTEFVNYMKNKGIELLIRDVVPNHLQKGLGLDNWALPVTEKLAKEIVRLPLYPELKNEEIDYIIYHINKFNAKR